MRTTPMVHQTEALRRSASKPSRPCSTDSFAYLMEMGCGKSWVILAEWQAAVNRGELRDLLVLAPAGSYRNWFEDKGKAQQSELRAHLDPALFNSALIAGWTAGAESKHQRERLMGEAVNAAMLGRPSRPRALFVNTEALSTGGKAEELCKEFLLGNSGKAPGQAMMVIDESTRIRGRKAERRKAVMRLRGLAKTRRICTGEVAPKSPLDLYWQFYFLDPRILGFDSYVAFQARYAVTKKVCFLPQAVLRARFLNMATKHGEMRRKLSQIYDKPVDSYMPVQQAINEIKAAAEGMPRDQMIEAMVRMAGGGYVRDVVPKIEGFRHVEELHARIAPYSHRVLKKDCLDLKPKIYMPPRDVLMTAEQKKIYAEIKKYATSELPSMAHVSATTVITKMIRLHQVLCGHVRDEDGALHDVPSNRIAAILEVLAEHSGKAIIWTTYDPEVRKIAAAIKKEYGPESCAMFWGGNRATRAVNERAFLSDPACRFMVSTQATGGIGNTWNVATLVIYAANSYDLELRIQSEDRCHRKGQVESVTYVDLCCAGTLEEKIIVALRGKMDLAAIVNGDNYREWLV